MTMNRHVRVFTDRFPSCTVPTLCLLRRRMSLSRELADDIVRMRGQRLYEYDWFLTPENVTNTYITVRFDGMKHGLARWFHENGIRWAELPFVNDKTHGVQRWWDSDNTLRSEYTFVNDMRHGVSRRWGNDGSLEHEVTFFHGVAT